MISTENVSKMENCKEKLLMQLLAEKGKPYVKKHDGYAVKMEEDLPLTYTDYNNTELTLTVPKGSYVMVEEDSSYPKIVTEKEWNDSNKFLVEENKSGKEEQKIGLESYMG